MINTLAMAGEVSRAPQLRNKGPRCLNIGNKLALFFLTILILTAANSYVAASLYEGLSQSARIINETGKLRYLSQKIAFLATRLDTDKKQVMEQDIRHYARTLDGIDQLLHAEGRMLLDNSPGLQHRLDELRAHWKGYGGAASIIIGSGISDLQKRQALDHLQGTADTMLDSANEIVETLTAADQTIRSQVRWRLGSTLVLEAIILLAAFLFVRRSISHPIRKLSQLCRTFAAGEHSVRMAHDSRDEIGELARAFNRTAETTSALIVAQNRLTAILEQTTDLVATFRPDGDILYLNEATHRLLGINAAASGDITVIYPQWARIQHSQVALPGAIASGHWTGESAVVTADGREIPVSQTLIAHRDAQGAIDHFSIIARDISDRIRMEEKLTHSRDFYLSLLHDFPDLIVRTDMKGNADYFNHTWLRFTGHTHQEELRGGWSDSLHDEDRATVIAALKHAVVQQTPLEIEYRLRRADGEYRWMLGSGHPYQDMEGGFAGILTSSHDITERKHIADQLERLASIDNLTGLPNRNLLNDRLGQALAFARRQQCVAAVMFLDIDRFKNINDSLGHDIGDRLLTAAADRLRACLRDGDTVARLGGDEFVVVLPDAGNEDGITAVADKLLGALATPFHISEHELFVSGSLGISLYPRDGTDAQTLLKNADTAMYRAKDEGRNNHQFYAAEMNARTLEHLSMENSLRRAMERNEFLLHYQPQVNLATGQTVGMEALVRWQHPEWGLVSPARFIPLAEETGLIVPIGEWVLRTACAQMKSWEAQGLPLLRVAVNLSARQFRQLDMANVVADALASTGLDARHLDLELTESMLMQDPDRVIVIMERLKAMGLRIALDDFGTGFSSLSYLKRFPIDEIKIDQGFVRGITQSPEDASIVRAIIAIADSLGLGVVAEGVETKGQHHYLRRHGCERMQGYLFSRPVPADEFATLLADNRRLSIDGDEPGQRTLLIVDDEPGIVSALKRSMRRDGYRILVAADGTRALELLAEHDVQVIISDQRMPGMSGNEFFGRVKELHPDTMRIMLSGYTEVRTVTEAVNLGAIHKFVAKPWDDDELREHVREAFWRHETTRRAKTH